MATPGRSERLLPARHRERGGGRLRGHERASGRAARLPGGVARGGTLWALLSGGGIAGCEATPATDAAGVAQAPAVAHDVRWIEHGDPEAEFGAAGGYFDLTPPIALPSSSPARANVIVRVSLPPGRQIGLQAAAARPSLEFPPGTRIDRVEWVELGQGRVIDDVRGTRIDDAGRHWHRNFRRVVREGRPLLVGVEWPADDRDAHAAATKLLLERLAHELPLRSVTAARRERALASLASKADCVGCHERDRPDNAWSGEYGLVNRGTDASGFFTPSFVFEATAPVESYGQHDRSVTSPYGVVWCPDGGLASVVERGAKRAPRWACGDAVPTASLALEEALAADDADAKRVCFARGRLWAHFDESARRAFAAGAAACAIDEASATKHGDLSHG